MPPGLAASAASAPDWSAVPPESDPDGEVADDQVQQAAHDVPGAGESFEHTVWAICVAVEDDASSDIEDPF
jgi:hypothetical protein